METIALKPWDSWQKYRLVAKPNLAALHRISQVRSQFQQLYPQEGKYPEAELVFFSHRLPESSENLLVRWLENLCANQNQFEVVLNNFSGVPPHLLYMRVQPTASLRSFADRLNGMMNQLSLQTNGNLAGFTHWRMNMLTGLPGMLFDKALQFFSKQELHLIISVEQLELKREITEGNWQLIQRFNLAASEKDFSKPWYQFA